MVERKLKAQIIEMKSSHEIEMGQLADKLTNEKKNGLDYKEQYLKAKENLINFDKYKNTMIKEIFQKDEQINQLSLQVHELKSLMRQNETKQFEEKMKQLEKQSYEKSILDYDSNQTKVNSTRGLRRSKSPFNENGINNETVMYGGGNSVLDSMIASFPQEKNSEYESNDYTSRKSREQAMTPVIDLASHTFQQNFLYTHAR